MMTQLRDNADYAKTAWALKTADESVNNTTVEQDDDELFFEMTNGETWRFTFHLRVTVRIASDFSAKLSHPGGTGYQRWNIYRENTGTGAVEYSRSGAVGTSYGVNHGADTEYFHIIDGYYTATATGTFKLQWAQRVAVAHDFPVVQKDYSYVIAHRTAWP